MRRHTSVIASGTILASILFVTCARVPPHPRVDAVGDRFSGEMARAHVESLAGLTPRLPDTREDLRAREYIEQELRLARLSIEEIEDANGRHIVATLPGGSADGLLLVAAYPALSGLERLDDSGVGLLLELARVFGRAPEGPYTLQFAFCETRPESLPDPRRSGSGARPGWGPVSTEEAARARLVAAGRSLARSLASRGELGRLRGVVVFDQVGAPDLRLARDLRSHPVYREIFWESAGELGLAATFPSDDGWASADGVALGFREQAMDRVVALTDETVARPDLERVPGPRRVSAATLERVGAVTVAALGRIMDRLVKVDAFASDSDLNANP